MITHRARILAAFRGEQVDVLPYVPRIDLWYLANKVAGTLPPQHTHRTQNEISRAEGWALHHKYAYSMVGETVDNGLLHRGIGIYQIRDALVDFVWPEALEVRVSKEGELTTVEYRTPVGMVSCTMKYGDSMERLGISIPHNTSHLIKRPEDYGPACWLFEHLDVVPNYARFQRWAAEEMGEDGVPVAVAFHGASPMQQIQRDLIDATQFFFHYKDHAARLRALAERMEPLYDKILRYSAASPADVIMWGVNFDDMLTYPPYFQQEIQPWIRKAAEALGAKGKMVMCHTDGENRGLMDLIRDSGMHIAESICPAPMTSVSLAEHYRHWSGSLTLMGGIPSTTVLPETSHADFEAFMDELFRAVAPGTRMVAGIADQVPPNAVFSRLQRIGERIEREGRLPLAAGGFRPAPAHAAATTAHAAATAPRDDKLFAQVTQDVLDGDQQAVAVHALALIEQGIPAGEILDRGLIAAMDVIGRQFASGEAFIPEVLLSARAMNKAVEALGPHLARSGDQQRGRILIGTVSGDMHDIGKNMVVTMLKGVGFEVKDLGVNVSRETFVKEVSAFQPDILGLSALLTTTMIEMREVIAALDEHRQRGRCKVMVGGAPVSEAFAKEIGADGWAGDAMGAVATAKRLLAARPPAIHR
jgi:methylmalonyl-CoA mutase cobalamin-binding domain/chain